MVQSQGFFFFWEGGDGAGRRWMQIGERTTESRTHRTDADKSAVMLWHCGTAVLRYSDAAVQHGTVQYEVT